MSSRSLFPLTAAGVEVGTVIAVAGRQWRSTLRSEDGPSRTFAVWSNVDPTRRRASGNAVLRAAPGGVIQVAKPT